MRSGSDVGFPGMASNTFGGEPFRIEEELPAGCDVNLFVLYGEVDLHVAPELRERLTRVVATGGRHLVIDLTKVTFLDSMALGVLLRTLKQLRASGGELRLVVPRTELRRIFEITLLDEVFTLVPTRREALAAFTGSWES